MKVMVIGNIGFDLMAPYLRQLKIETILVSIVGANFNGDLADRTYFFDSKTDIEPLVELAVTEKVDGVISIAGPDIVNLRDAYVKETLERDYGIPVLANPLPAVRIAVDKAKTKRWLWANGFPVTPGAVAHSLPEARNLAEQFGYPVVLKLIDHSGGVGLKVIERRGQLARQRCFPVLIEKYVEGREFSVEVLNYKERSLALLPVFKGATNHQGIHPMERVKMAPAPLPERETARLRQLARSVVTRLGLQPTADVDIVWGSDGPQILEINPRFGGITALSMAASGVTSYWALVDMILGRWDPVKYRFNRSYAADLPIASDVPTHLVPRLLSIDGVFRVKIQKLKQTTGRIALKAKTREQLVAAAREVARICRCDNCFTELEQLLS